VGIGAYSLASTNTIPPDPDSVTISPEVEDHPFESAALEGIVCAWVYYSPEENDNCRGILLEYENGGQRALGQCRVNEDPFKRYPYPSLICFLKKWITPTSVQVHVDFGHIHGQQEAHDQPGWECHPLRGTLSFLYTIEYSDVLIKQD
jgi:hypothetical protein